MALATNTTAGEIQLAGDLAGNNDATAPALSSTGVTAGQYNFANLTIDAKGRVTSASAGSPASVAASLPLATASTAGVFKLCDGLEVNAGAQTAGYQDVDFNVTLTGGTTTGLNSCAFYSFSITVDFGSVQTYSTQGSSLSTIQDVVDFINSNVIGATAAISSDKIKITSDTNGRLSAVVISQDQLFQCITDFNQIEGEVFGTDTGCISATKATDSVLGVVKIGSGIDVTNGVISLTTPEVATTTTTGVVSIGAGLNVDINGEISVASAPIATTTTLGQIIVPTSGGLDIDGSGNISVPDATSGAKGVIQGGNHVTITSGILDVDKASGATTYGAVRSADTNNLVITAGEIDVGTNVGKLNTNNTWNSVQSFNIVTLTDAANISTDASTSNNFKVTLAGNRTLDNPTNLVAGTVYTWEIIQDATGSRTLSYGTKFKFKNGYTNTLLGTASQKQYLTCICDGTDLFCALTGEYS